MILLTLSLIRFADYTDFGDKKLPALINKHLFIVYRLIVDVIV